AEEVTSGPILDLDDPDVGIEAQFARQSFLDLGLGRGMRRHAGAEQPLRRPPLVECALRRRAIELGSTVEPAELDENGARFLGAAMTHRREGTLDIAAA